MNRGSLVAAIVITLLASPVQADWPMQRHDPARTGLANGSSDITEPVPYFRHYLGGALRPLELITADVTGNALDDIIYVSGGRALAKRSNDLVIWETAPRGFTSIVGIANLDGVGGDELVLTTRDRSVVLDLATGTILWVEPEGEMGTLGGMAIGDLDGDNLPDLLMQECGCCGVFSGNTGFIYSFASGFATPQLVSTLPYAACGASSRSLTLLDVDGVPPLEVINNTYGEFNLVDGSTGAILSSSPTLGTWISAQFCRGHDVDGVPGDELLCVMNIPTQPAVNQRRITRLGFDNSMGPPQLNVAYSNTIAPDAGGDVTWVDPFVDLDDDGTIEIIVGTKDAADVWTTRIYDALTGNELASINGERLAGTASIEEAGKALVLTTSGTSLNAYAYAAGVLTPRWSEPEVAVLTTPNRSRRPTSQLFNELTTVDLDNDGVDELIVRRLVGPPTVAAYKATGGSAVLHASHTFATGVDLLNSWILPPVDIMAPQLAAATNDGFLLLFDQQLMPTNASVLQSSGIRIGGYYANGGWRNLQTTPVVAAIDGGADEAIIAVDSRGALLKLDAADASLAKGPTVEWERTNTFGAAIVDALDQGAPAIATFAVQEPVTSPPVHRVRALRPDGTPIFDVPLEGPPLNDLVPVTIDGDASTDLAFQWGNPSDTEQQTRAIAGLTGATLWDATPFESGCGRQPAGLSATMYDGDGLSEVFAHGGSAYRAFSGVDGSQLAMSAFVGGCYHMGTFYDVDGDTTDEIILHASNAPTTLVTNDMQTVLWQSTDVDTPYPYAAVAPCASGPVLVGGSWSNPARLKMTQLSGAQQGSAVTTVLAAGQKFVSEVAAEASGAYLGQLTSATVHTDLTGLGRPTVLVGSTDGFLYGVDPCADTLDFALDFGTAVGEAVFGDTDGDGRDEILVTAADGFLYGLRHEAIESPSNVIDTDPDQGITTQDVDTIMSADKLSGSWSAIPGATSYEVAVLVAGGDFVFPWQDVGTQTEFSATGLPLMAGTAYVFAVRAINAAGDPSVDALSDGVVVQGVVGQGGGSVGGAGGMGAGGMAGTGGMGGVATGGADGTGGTPAGGGTEADGGCGCVLVGGPQEQLAPWWLLLAAAAATRRRRPRE